MIDIVWKPSPNFNRIKNRQVKGIVIHTAECKEIKNARLGVMSWLTSKLSKASAHYIVDNEGIVQCVKDDEVAWHAGKVNDWTIGIELAGSAKQTADEWRDLYSQSVIQNAAKLVAQLCATYAIPSVHLDDVGILTRARGIFGHVDANRAHGVKGGHFDPGPNFNWDLFVELVRKYSNHEHMKGL